MVPFSLLLAINREQPIGRDLRKKLMPESCTRYCSEAQKALSLKGDWSNFDSQAYCLYGENQNCETTFKDKVLQATVDGWCKIQVLSL